MTEVVLWQRRNPTTTAQASLSTKWKPLPVSCSHRFKHSLRVRKDKRNMQSGKRNRRTKHKRIQKSLGRKLSHPRLHYHFGRLLCKGLIPHSLHQLLCRTYNITNVVCVQISTKYLTIPDVNFIKMFGICYISYQRWHNVIQKCYLLLVLIIFQRQAYKSF